MRVHLFFSVVALLGCFALCLGKESPASFVLKERWQYAPNGWIKGGRAPKDRKIDLIIAVKLQNTDVLERTLLEVADPDHDHYGQHLSQEQVNRLVAPSQTSLDAVATWIDAYRAGNDTVTFTPNSDFVTVHTTIGVAERMLACKYFKWIHPAGLLLMRADGHYSVPLGVSQHVDFVGPTIRFPVPRIRKLRSSAGRKLHQLGGVITPAVLRKLYGVGSASATSPKTIQSCASFLGQFYAPSDLQDFFNQFDKEAVGRTPKLFGPNEPGNPGVEASLDIQYIMAMGNNATTYFWSTPGQQPHNPENEPFMVWLTNVSALSDATIPKVISVSYGDNEGGVNFDYATRVNSEFQKLGTRGVSIMFSSGDGGVAGGQPTACSKFIPTFPAGSPWVTAVGGTQSSNPETAASFSSGGFSNYWARPSYQDSAVKHYFSVATGLPTKGLYNATGAGFPDVSAQSESFNVVQGGSVVLFGVDGTSCSSPTFSGIMSLLVDARLNAGKTPLGFLNILFYKNPGVFNDVTSGNNPGCGTNGFSAAAGWDPVTGLGTPNFPKMLSLVKSLK